MQRFAPAPPVPGEVPTGPDRLRFGLLALLLVATFLMGGSARHDAASLLFLRPLTAVIFVAAIVTALPAAWRRAPDSRDEHIGLVHALVLLDTDTTAITEIANAFEAAIGGEHRYQADKMVSVSELLGKPNGLQAAFEHALEQVLRG